MLRGDVKGKPAAETLAKIAKASGVDLRWLTTGDGAPGSGEAVETPQVHPKHREQLAAMVPEDTTAIEMAISRAFKGGAGDRFVISDGTAAVLAARSLPMFIHEGTEDGWARDFVEAARWLRLKGAEVTSQAVKDRVLVVRYGLSSEQLKTLSAEANSHADVEAEKWNKPSKKK
jgi:hypothetical protein